MLFALTNSLFLYKILIENNKQCTKDEGMKTENVFDTSIQGLAGRRQNIDDNLDDLQISEWISSEIKNEKTGKQAYSTQVTDRVGDYLMGANDVDGPRKLKYAFYPSESAYYRTKISRVTTVSDVYNDRVALNEYQKAEHEDRAEYINRLFDPKSLCEEDFRRFIRSGLVYSKLESEMSEKLKIKINAMRQMVLQSSINDDDKHFLKYFNGVRTITEIALLLGVSRQAVSKKIKKIAKKSLKMVAASQKKDHIG